MITMLAYRKEAFSAIGCSAGTAVTSSSFTCNANYYLNALACTSCPNGGFTNGSFTIGSAWGCVACTATNASACGCTVNGLNSWGVNSWVCPSGTIKSLADCYFPAGKDFASDTTGTQQFLTSCYYAP